MCTYYLSCSDRLLPFGARLALEDIPAGIHTAYVLLLAAGSNATPQLVDKKLRDSQKTKMFGKRFSAFTYLGFVVLQFFLYVCNADAGGTGVHA